MTEDIINQLSQATSDTKVPSTPVLFPEIPDPPEGFDPEKEVLFKDRVPHSDSISGKKKKATEGMVARARVFLVGPEGNNEYEKILALGLSGKYVLGKKDVTDLRGSNKFKIYLEWIELPAKK
jgi:hypothetical protein